MGREEVKVVLIDTQHVITDPKSFKSVVQSLTGKDSCVSWIEETSYTSARKRKRPQPPADWKLTKGLSFKDLDRMILEMPPVEDLYQLWAQNNLLNNST
ncbi:VQ motif-containing protein [Euphorbia peplus]|nr:VQ motif-containing protein [Euphorbia peplus]